MEAAKTAAINQEIKRVLTEVLLKVTSAERVIVVYFNSFYRNSNFNVFY